MDSLNEKRKNSTKRIIGIVSACILIFLGVQNIDVVADAVSWCTGLVTPLIIGLAFVFAYPFIYLISTSLMSNADLSSSTVQWLPTEVKFENFAVALQLMKIKQYAYNSLNNLLYTVISAARILEQILK